MSVLSCAVCSRARSALVRAKCADGNLLLLQNVSKAHDFLMAFVALTN
jgi:hypothetical protein